MLALTGTCRLWETFMQISVRPAEPGDASRLAAFIQPYVDDGKLLPRTAEELDTLTANGFIAECDGRIVGFSALEIYSPKLAEVRSLAVSSEMRGRGLGRQLVEACLARARERNVLEVLAVSSAEEFFLSCGFDFTLPDEKKAFFHQTREV
ncbi:MAG: GNAT family N-acetyltransferase [Planctomycetaceae bacterium]